MFIVFLGSVILRDSPLNAVQMLWVNLVMDTLGALALSTEPPAEDVLERQPADKDEQIISPVMWRNIACHAFIQIIMLLVLIFVIPGWLVHDYEILQKNIPFVTATDGTKTCSGFHQVKRPMLSIKPMVCK
jgi:magnesium-transporting ATPase (P-type)